MLKHAHDRSMLKAEARVGSQLWRSRTADASQVWRVARHAAPGINQRGQTPLIFPSHHLPDPGHAMKR